MLASPSWGTIREGLISIDGAIGPAPRLHTSTAQSRSRRWPVAKGCSSNSTPQATEELRQSGVKIPGQPVPLQLRNLQTIREISSEQSAHVMIPLPTDLLTPFLRPKAGGKQPGTSS